MNGYHALLLVAAALSAAAAWFDLRTARIPNWLSLGALAAAPFLHVVVAVASGQSPVEIGQSVAGSIFGALACGVVPFLLFRRQAIGAGDVKLFAAVGALCRPVVGFQAQTYAFVVGMVFALVMVARQGKLRTTLGNVASLFRLPVGDGAAPATARPELERMTSFRLAPSIFVGVCIAALLDWRVQ